MKKREQTGKGEEEEGSSSPLCVWSVENHISTIATTIINGSSNDSSRTPPSFFSERETTDERTKRTETRGGPGKQTDGRIETDLFMTTTTMTTTREKQSSKYPPPLPHQPLPTQPFLGLLTHHLLARRLFKATNEERRRRRIIPLFASNNGERRRRHTNPPQIQSSPVQSPGVSTCLIIFPAAVGSGSGGSGSSSEARSGWCFLGGEGREGREGRWEGVEDRALSIHCGFFFGFWGEWLGSD